MVKIKTKLSKSSGPIHSIKIIHQLDPVIPESSGFSLNAPSQFFQKSPFIIASSLSVIPRLIKCFGMPLGGFIKTMFFSNVYPIITFFFFWSAGGWLGRRMECWIQDPYIEASIQLFLSEKLKLDVSKT